MSGHEVPALIVKTPTQLAAEQAAKRARAEAKAAEKAAQARGRCSRGKAQGCRAGGGEAEEGHVGRWHNKEGRARQGTAVMDEDHRRQPVPKDSSHPSRPLRAAAATGARGRALQIDRPHCTPVAYAFSADGTVVTPRPRVRQPPPSRPVRRRPPMRLPLASAHRRLHVLLIAVAMALSLCVGRLLQLQGFDSSSYTAEALTRTLPLLPARGELTDRNGLVLASTQPAVAVTADPKLTAPRAAEFASVLAGHLGMTEAELMPLLTKTGTRFCLSQEEGARALTYSALAADLSGRDLHGVFRESDPIRTYPNGSVGASVVGFVGADGKGLAGLERTLNAQLAGVEGKETYESAPEWQQDSARPEFHHTGTQWPQLPAHARLRGAVDRRTAACRTGCQDPRRFRLRHRHGRQDRSADRPGQFAYLRLVQATGCKIRRPGQPRGLSTVRARKRAEGLDLGGIDRLRHGDAVHSRRHSQPSRLRRAFDQGSLLPWRAALHDAGVIADSSNIGTALLTRQLDKQKLRDYLVSFGLGAKTNIQLPGEVRRHHPQART